MFGSDDLIEDDFREPYLAWKKAPGPETNTAMLKALQPTIDGAVRTHVGASNPLLLSRARLLALEGLQSYDPKRGRLQTHLYNQLQSLKRVNRQQTTVLRVPERISLDRYNLENANQELTHNLGREPTDSELSDHTGFSIKRIAQVRAYTPAVSEGLIEALTEGTGPMGGTESVGPKASPIHMEIVYDELDNYHRKIMEYAFGMNGRRMLSNQEIARKMNRSPGAISQAKLRIQKLLDDAEEVSQHL